MNRYIAFLKVFERNSFSDAARDLGYTQSAVSQMIKSLEEELGVTLLVRSRSGVALTYEGRHLLPYIRDTVNAYRMLQSQAAGFSAETSSFTYLLSGSTPYRETPSLLRSSPSVSRLLRQNFSAPSSAVSTGAFSTYW